MAAGSSRWPDGWLVCSGGDHLSADPGIGILAEAGPPLSAAQGRQPWRSHPQAGGPPLSTPGDGWGALVRMKDVRKVTKSRSRGDLQDLSSRSLSHSDHVGYMETVGMNKVCDKLGNQASSDQRSWQLLTAGNCCSGEWEIRLP